MAFDKITGENCYFTMGICSPSEIEKLVKIMLNNKKNFNDKYAFLTNLITECGYSLSDIISTFHEYLTLNTNLLNKQYTTEQIIFIFDSLSNIEDKMNSSTFEEI